jgi:hypothetical protein
MARGINLIFVVAFSCTLNLSLVRASTQLYAAFTNWTSSNNISLVGVTPTGDGVHVDLVSITQTLGDPSLSVTVPTTDGDGNYVSQASSFSERPSVMTINVRTGTKKLFPTTTQAITSIFSYSSKNAFILSALEPSQVNQSMLWLDATSGKIRVLRNDIPALTFGQAFDPILGYWWFVPFGGQPRMIAIDVNSGKVVVQKAMGQDLATFLAYDSRNKRVLALVQNLKKNSTSVAFVGRDGSLKVGVQLKGFYGLYQVNFSPMNRLLMCKGISSTFGGYYYATYNVDTGAGPTKIFESKVVYTANHGQLMDTSFAWI